jgi:rhomboid protease GluP
MAIHFVSSLSWSSPRMAADACRDRVRQIARSTLETLTPYLTLSNALLGVCVITHGMTLIYPTLLIKGAFYLPFIMKGEVWRLATSCVLHLNIIHLACNMHTLHTFGPEIERRWGASGFAQIAAMAIAANAIARTVWPLYALSVGLSGVLYGMIGASYANAYAERLIDMSDVLGVSGRLIAGEVLIRALMPVDSVAHVSGLVAGVAFGLFSSEPRHP